LKLEACIETLAEAKLAAKHNINRVELCAALDLGGLTPTTTMIHACAEIIEVHAMIRPRAGNFVYNAEELAIMLAEITEAKKAGATGVVFGCLTNDNKIDFALTQHLVLAAQKNGLCCTFHRAIDLVPNQLKALDQLIQLGINRVLTSGGKATAIEGKENILQMIKVANGRIEIMAGSGVNASNVATLKAANVDALHFSIRQKSGEPLPLGMGNNYEPDENKIKSIMHLL